MDHGLDEAELIRWVETSLRDQTHILAAGYQGKTLEYRDHGQHLVIKVPHGTGLLKYFHTLMLRHEYKVYQQLEGFSACPKCYGMLANTYLILEYIKSRPIREHRPARESGYYSSLFENIQALHQRRVAHMDLKKKDNLLVTKNEQPCLIDFGASVIYKPGFHPLNHYWFKLASQFDYNAWLKHKYHDDEASISAEDSQYHNRTLLERIAKRIKSSYHTALNTFR